MIKILNNSVLAILLLLQSCNSSRIANFKKVTTHTSGPTLFFKVKINQIKLNEFTDFDSIPISLHQLGKIGFKIKFEVIDILANENMNLICTNLLDSSGSFIFNKTEGIFLANKTGVRNRYLSKIKRNINGEEFYLYSKVYNNRNYFVITDIFQTNHLKYSKSTLISIKEKCKKSAGYWHW